MISRPARYSAPVAGSSGCAGGGPAVWSGRTAVSVMADLPVERNGPGLVATAEAATRSEGYSSAMIEPTRSPRPGSRLTSQIE